MTIIIFFPPKFQLHQTIEDPNKLRAVPTMMSLTMENSSLININEVMLKQYRPATWQAHQQTHVGKDLILLKITARV